MSFRKFRLGAAVIVALSVALTTNVFALTINRGMDGYWYEVDQDPAPRRGWAFQYLDGPGPEQGVLFVTGFVFDNEGNQLWLSGNTLIVDGQFDVDIELNRLEGGSFGPDAGTPTQEVWGSMNVTFNSCTSADITFTSAEIDDFTNEFTHVSTALGDNREEMCVYQTEFAGCPAGTTDGPQPRTCVLEGTYNDDIHLTNDTYWLLNGAVFIGARAEEGDPVPDGPALSIEPGTRIIGLGGSTNALYISRGSKIMAEGTSFAPIVMTGVNSATEGALSQDWGGLVINGAAPLNDGFEATGEGDSGYYGGADPDDSSGVLKYVRVQFAGEKINDEDELNGIAFQGVGRGTVVDYIQVHRNADDGIEFFGGTVNAKHLVLTDIEDDSVDWTQGWQGRIQYVLVKQIQDETVDTDRGMELDNLEDNFNAEPRSGGVMANVTLIGKAGATGSTMRRGTGGNFHNFIFTGFSSCLDIDDEATFTAAGTPQNLTGVLTMENTIVNCGTNFVEEDGGPWTVESFFNAQPGNVQVNPMLDDVFLPEDSPYLSGYELDPDIYDDFFDKVDYIGAFGSRESAWIWGWTDFLGF